MLCKFSSLMKIPKMNTKNEFLNTIISIVPGTDLISKTWAAGHAGPFEVYSQDHLGPFDDTAIMVLLSFEAFKLYKYLKNHEKCKVIYKVHIKFFLTILI